MFTSRRKNRHIFETSYKASSSSSSENTLNENQKKRVVIIGGGWAGFSAAESISKNSEEVEVILLDASKRGGGLAAGWDVDKATKKKRSMEMGIHGFWREYTNTFDIINNKIEGIDNIDDILTPYLPSVLVSEYGKVATAPVLGDKEGVLPPAIDIALKANINIGDKLTPFDLLSGLNLLPYYADFIPNDDSKSPKSSSSSSSWERYDQISAENLFLYKAKISKNLYKQLALPLLHVLPMTTGWDVSASAALSCFHVFALQSHGAFDVRWCRGSITDKIFNPWMNQLDQRGVIIQNGKFVSSIDQHDHHQYEYQIKLNDHTTIQTNAIIFAVGGPAMNKIIQSSSFLQNKVVPSPENYAKLRGITCVSVRIFLKPNLNKIKTNCGHTELPTAWANAMNDSPVFVCGPNIVSELIETGFCIYDLQRLQDYYTVQDEDDSSCAVLHVDYFRANAIANMKDDAIVKLTLRAISKALTNSETYDESCTVVEDAYVNRARNAVSHFRVNSASLSPSITLDKDHSLYMCGDWVERCNDDENENGHSSWSTEKAVVTGRQAAKTLCQKWDLECYDDIIPVKKQVYVMKQIRSIAKRFSNLIMEG